MKKNQQGFAEITLIIIIILAGLLAWGTIRAINEAREQNKQEASELADVEESHDRCGEKPGNIMSKFTMDCPEGWTYDTITLSDWGYVWGGASPDYEMCQDCESKEVASGMSINIQIQELSYLKAQATYYSIDSIFDGTHTADKTLALPTSKTISGFPAVEYTTANGGLYTLVTRVDSDKHAYEIYLYAPYNNGFSEQDINKYHELLASFKIPE